MSHRVLVTGANGFIGRAVAQALRDKGCEVVGIDLHADPARGVQHGDTTDPSSWRAAAAGCDTVVHTAAVVSNAVGAAEQWRVNVLGTHHALEVAAGAGVTRFVHLSSVRAFSDTGFPPDVTEEHPVRPDGNAYVDTKIASEHVVLAAHAAGRLETVVVRPGDVYGPGSQPWVLKPLALIRSGRFVLPARGRGVFSPVYVDDLVAGVLLAAEHPRAAGEIFTIGGGVGVPSAEYFGHLCRFAGRRGPLVLPTAPAMALAGLNAAVCSALRRPSEANPVSMRYLTRRGTYSIEKAARVLGYAPQVDLAEGMRRTEVWLREQGLIA